MAIGDKNFHWWHRYRAVNGYSIYGTRGEAGFDGTYRNRDVMEGERAILDQMCANRDERIWSVAQGKPVPAAVDDSNTLPFIEPKTNVGGPDDKNRQAGKLGSLDYLSGKEQQQRFKLADGCQIELFASEEQFPLLANPVALNFDSQGRAWVSVMPSYPQWKPKTKLDDKLLILEDNDLDGRADECKIFARGLHQPTGFELGHTGVFVAQQPDLLFLQDTDGDDQEDSRIRRKVGFDTADSHHGLAVFEWGPGGGLYFSEGTFKQSQVETIDGPARLSDAGVWRYDPRTEKFSVHASLAFANPWGHVFDRWGQNFIADASPGHNFWATAISGFVALPDKHPGGSRAKHLDWGGSKSNKSYPTFIKMRIRPSSGCELVSSSNFPPEVQGNYLLNNVIAAAKSWANDIPDSDEHSLLEVLWLHQTHNVVNRDLLVQLLNAQDARARAAATRVLCYWRDQVTNSVTLVKARIDDPHPRVRLEAVRACSFFASDEVQEAVLEVLNYDMDEYLEYTLDETLRVFE